MIQVPVIVLRRCPLPSGTLLLAGERATVPESYLKSLLAGPEPFVAIDTTPDATKALIGPPKDTMIKQADVNKQGGR